MHLFSPYNLDYKKVDPRFQFNLGYFCYKKKIGIPIMKLILRPKSFSPVTAKETSNISYSYINKCASCFELPPINIKA